MNNKQPSTGQDAPVYISLVQIDYEEDQPSEDPSPFGADGWENMGFSDGFGDRNHSL